MYNEEKTEEGPKINVEGQNKVYLLIEEKTDANMDCQMMFEVDRGEGGFGRP